MKLYYTIVWTSLLLVLSSTELTYSQHNDTSTTNTTKGHTRRPKREAPGLLSFLLERPGSNKPDPSRTYPYERQRYDGWFNNMAHPNWGVIGGHSS